jgi:transcriptional regulator with XRE-family HTH domain
MGKKRLYIHQNKIGSLMNREDIASQSKVARSMLLSSQNLNRYLRGRNRPTPTIIEKLCAAFNCQPGDFLVYGDPPSPSKARVGQKINFQKAEEIRSLYEAGGITQKELARKFGISPSMVSMIVRGLNWIYPET